MNSKKIQINAELNNRENRAHEGGFQERCRTPEKIKLKS
jgi:hypothetical protein